jgi:transcriptional regulator with XRE-family HTH domain
MISIWENNINEPKASYLKALAKALDVSVDFLLDEEN